jgi:hypothetical protein
MATMKHRKRDKPLSGVFVHVNHLDNAEVVVDLDRGGVRDRHLLWVMGNRRVR